LPVKKIFCTTEIFLFIAVIYFVICFAFTTISRWLEERRSWRKAI
jgi:polar amino acid transport system permease protein